MAFQNFFFSNNNKYLIDVRWKIKSIVNIREFFIIRSRLIFTSSCSAKKCTIKGFTIPVSQI